MKSTLPLALALVVSSVSVAQEAPPPLPPPEPPPAAPPGEPTLEVALKGGVHLPQLLSPLQTSFDAVLKVGLAPWSLKQLQAFADLSYSQPRQLVTADDGRLESGGSYQSELAVHDVRTTLGAQYFFLSPAARFVPWAGAGLRLNFLTLDVEASSQENFGRHVETVTRVGLTLLAGAGYRLGPGLLVGELVFTVVPVDERVTGQSNIGALGARLGYALTL